MTLKEIAKIVGVSSATVSLVLNNRDGVGAETRERVEDALRQYHYTPRKPQVKHRANNSIYVVKYAAHGMVVEENQGFISSIIDQIIQECHKNSIDVNMSNCNKASIATVISSIEASGAKGIIFIGTELTDQQAYILTGAKIPLVVVDNAFMYQNLSSVLMTNQDIAYIATKHLIDEGHREIGYLYSNARTPNFYWRSCGYEVAITEFHIKRGDSVPITPTLQKSYEDMRAYLRTTPALPTAFFADNDTIAIGAMRAMQEAGIRIPEDISIIGVDDIPYSAVCNPPLTTISVSRVEMGIQAVSLLLYKIEHPDSPPLRVQVCGELTIRKSTMCADGACRI